MRSGGLVGVLVLVWLLIGTYAAYDRGYFSTGVNSCGTAGTIALNVIAGPLNWVPNINPKIADCKPDVPPPSQ